MFHVVPGGHTDPITGANCHWNVFRVCNTTRMETNSVSKTLFDKYGKKWYFITPDYAFGHTLQQGFGTSLKQFGGTELGADLTPLGTTDFSSYLIKAQAANPDVIIFLHAGDDMINALKQAVQFGLDQRFHLAGAQQELEVLLGLPPETRIGTWVFEWHWNQPNALHIDEFVAEVRKKSGGHVPTARTWFGYAAIWTCALAAEAAKSLEAVKMAKLTPRENLRVPVEVAAGYRLSPWLPRVADGEVRARIAELMDMAGIGEKADRLVGELSHGDQRATEIMMALALKLHLLLLDEPTAGMDDQETYDITRLIRKLQRDQKMSIVLIEHDMRVVFHLADRIMVLAEGTTLAEGTPEEIAGNEAVQEAYLGKSAA